MTSKLRHRVTAAQLDKIVALALISSVAVAAATDRSIGVVAVVGGIVAASTVAFRRGHPALAIVVTGIAASIGGTAGGGHLTAEPIAFTLAYYALGQRSVDRGWGVVDGLLVAIALPGIATSPTTAKPGDILILDIASVWAFFVVLPFVVGHVVRARRRLTDAVLANAERLAAEQQESERQAASNERTRIARELHDVIAHSVSVMVIQTQAARVLAPDDPQGAAAVLGQVEACGRDAMFDLRRMVGVLRREGGDLLGAVRPGVAQLANLVERTRLAGLPVVLRIEGAVQPLPPSLDLVVYRLVQEALTNSLKHAGPAQGRVVLAFSPECLDIHVVDTGRGVCGGNGLSAGHGLVGIRERLALYDGWLEAGALESGGYQMHARIPLTGVMG